ncbi:MAG: hypothetical protein ACRCZF_03115, partial [Gemmataceae bacterium]
GILSCRMGKLHDINGRRNSGTPGRLGMRRTSWVIWVGSVSTAIGMAANTPAWGQPRTTQTSLTSLPGTATIPRAGDDVTPYVAPAFQDTVRKVLKNPTLSTRATEDTFAVHRSIYTWMLEHPDRVALAWPRLQVPCVEIADLGNGQFKWTDPQLGEITWQLVGRLPDGPTPGLIWYASGKVKPNALMPQVPVKAVAVLRYPGKPLDAQEAYALKPELVIHVQTEHRMAVALLRLLGPAGPRMAEDAAGQLLYFFSGVAKYLYKKPEKVSDVLAAAPTPAPTGTGKPAK